MRDKENLNETSYKFVVSDDLRHVFFDFVSVISQLKNFVIKIKAFGSLLILGHEQCNFLLLFVDTITFSCKIG